MSTYTATPAQKKNIRSLLAILVSHLESDLGNHYCHDALTTCTVGVAYRSGLFPTMNNSMELDDGFYDTIDGSGYDDIPDIIDDVFGSDYRRYVVFGKGCTVAADAEDSYNGTETMGKTVLRAIIKHIQSGFNVTPSKLTTVVTVTNTVEVDTTKNKILARIDDFAQFIAIAKKMQSNDTLSLNAQIRSAERQMTALMRALEL